MYILVISKYIYICHILLSIHESIHAELMVAF